MTSRVLFRPQARAELLEAQAWYEKQAPGLGADFALTVAAATAGIGRFPHAHPAVHGNIRKAVLRRFPYALLYVAEAESVVVLGCYHHRRDPEGWHSRS